MMAKLDERFIVPKQYFKNRIINGDFSVAQRGDYHSIFNDPKYIKYTFDRTIGASLGYYLSHQRSKIYAPDEGILANTLDIFGDGSCIACYTLDSNVNDLSSNYNGIWVGNEQYKVGRFGQAAYFDGDSYIKVNSNFGLSNQMTISLWYRWNGDTSDQRCLFGFYDQDTTDGRLANVLCLFLHPYSTSNIASLSINGVDHSLPRFDHALIHLVIVYDGSRVKMYQNMSKVFDADGQPNLEAVDFLLLGADYDPDQDPQYNGFFDGIIDQVRIFNRALTEDEIKVLYTESNNYKESPTYFLVSRVEDVDDSVSNPNIAHYVYRFEGQHLYDLAIQGKKVTLSFDFAANKNGDYSLSFRNKTDGIIDSYVKRFTYTGNGEFQKFTFIFDLSEFPKRFKCDVNMGFEIIIGSNNTDYEVSSEGLFTNVDYHFITGTNNFEVGDWIKLKNIQLEEGDVATKFEYVPYDVQLLRCMRYFYKFDYRANGDAIYFLKYVDSDKHYFASIHLKTRMRTQPTITRCEISSDVTNIILSDFRPFYINQDVIQVYGTSSDGNPVTTNACVYTIEADAEIY